MPCKLFFQKHLLEIYSKPVLSYGLESHVRPPSLQLWHKTMLPRKLLLILVAEGQSDTCWELNQQNENSCITTVVR